MMFIYLVDQYSFIIHVELEQFFLSPLPSLMVESAKITLQNLTTIFEMPSLIITMETGDLWCHTARTISKRANITVGRHYLKSYLILPTKRFFFFPFRQFWLGIRSNHVTVPLCQANCYASRRTAYSPSSPFYLRHKQYPICVPSSRKLTWPLARNCTGLTDQTMVMRNEENVWVFDDRNHWSQRLIAILFKPIQKAKKREEEKSLNIAWANEALWGWDHSKSWCSELYDSKATSPVPTREKN